MINTIIKNSAKTKQVLSLFSANIIGLPIGVLTSILITKTLGVEEFGDYRFIQSIFNLSLILFAFGFYQSGNRILVLNSDHNKSKEYYGAMIAVTFLLYVVMMSLILIYALIDDNLKSKNITIYIYYLVPFCWVYLLQKFFETLFQADNRISLLIKSRLYPQVVFVFLLFIIPLLKIDYFHDKLGIILGLYVITQVIVSIFIIRKLQISFCNLRENMRNILQCNKEFGFDTYVGSLFAVGCAQLSVFFISYNSSDNSGVGFYSLALTLAAPLAFIPNTIATTHYREFSLLKSIPKNIFILTTGICMLALFSLWILVDPFVNYFYGVNYSRVTELTLIISVGVLAHGMADFVNRYMAANGQGKSLRNTSFLVGASILLGNTLMVPQWGVYGAAFSNIFSGLVYFFSITFGYYRFIKRIN